MIKRTTLKIFEKIINDYLKLDPFTPEKFIELNGKSLCIDITGINIKIYVYINNDRIQLSKNVENEADTTITGSPIALAKLGLHDEVMTSMLAGEVKISGDTRTGKKIKKIMSEMDIDWEEHMSKITGDVIAHRITNVFHKMRHWGRRTASSFTEDVSDYLLEESRTIINKHELEKFYSKVDSLRDEADKLQARLSRLS